MRSHAAEPATPQHRTRFKRASASRFEINSTGVSRSSTTRQQKLAWRGYRINQKRISDDGYRLVTLIVVCLWSVASSIWELRRSVQRDILPRKHRLQAWLKELDAS